MAFRCRIFKNGTFAGSGCLVGPSLALTAWHVVAVSPPGQAQEPAPEIKVRLSDGRFLKVGLSLQLSTDAPAAQGSTPGVNGAKARDAAIGIFGQRDYEQLLSPKGRAAAVRALDAEVRKRYDGEVLQVYLTEFVMQ